MGVHRLSYLCCTRILHEWPLPVHPHRPHVRPYSHLLPRGRTGAVHDLPQNLCPVARAYPLPHVYHGGHLSHPGPPGYRHSHLSTAQDEPDHHHAVGYVVRDLTVDHAWNRGDER